MKPLTYTSSPLLSNPSFSSNPLLLSYLQQMSNNRLFTYFYTHLYNLCLILFLVNSFPLLILYNHIIYSYYCIDHLLVLLKFGQIFIFSIIFSSTSLFITNLDLLIPYFISVYIGIYVSLFYQSTLFLKFFFDYNDLIIYL